MNYLLDTCAYVNLLMKPEIFSKRTLSLFNSGEHEFYVSSISGLEIAIKRNIGKLHINTNDYWELSERGLSELSLTYQHTYFLNELPNIHNDPFDRVLIAQAHCEQMPLITSDREIKKYPILTVDL